MNELTRQHLENLYSSDRELQTQAFFQFLNLTDQPVEWAYAAWDGLVADSRHPENHVRAIAAQILCNLAKSDPEKRILRDFPSLLAVTRDERFVTARHCLQALWKIGVTGEAQKQILVDGLASRFAECVTEKNCTLIRYDILQDLRNLYDVVRDEKIRKKAEALIETETQQKYRKKYAGIWKVK